MNSIQRVESVFQLRHPDKLPLHHIGFSSQVASAILERDAHVGGGVQQCREALAWWNGEDAHNEFVERSFKDASKTLSTLRWQRTTTSFVQPTGA